jgi:hypothetical protein
MPMNLVKMEDFPSPRFPLVYWTLLLLVENTSGYSGGTRWRNRWGGLIDVTKLPNLIEPFVVWSQKLLHINIRRNTVNTH